MTHPLSILLLEDQGLVRAGMRVLIQMSEPHSSITEVANYEEAIAQFTSTKFDIAFLDIDLKSDKSGLDVLKMVREMELDTRIIMLSGHAEREIIMECINLGASGYILKDMEGDGVFRRALDTIFQGSIFLPSSIIRRGGYSPTTTQKPNSLDGLGITGRSLETLYYLCQGLPNKSIARKMNIEEGTIRKDYVPKLFRIFNVARRTELILEISRRNLSIPTPSKAY